MPVVGSLEELDDVIAGYDVTRVIVAFSRARHQQFLDIVRACADRGVRVNIVPRLFEILSSQTAWTTSRASRCSTSPTSS